MSDIQISTLNSMPNQDVELILHPEEKHLIQVATARAIDIRKVVGGFMCETNGGMRAPE